TAECRSSAGNSGAFVIPFLRRPRWLEIFHVWSMRLESEAHVMRYRRMFRPNLNRGDPRVLRKSGRYGHPHPFDHVVLRVGWNIKRRALHDDIGTNHPAFSGPFDKERRILKIALQCSAVDPFHDRIDVAL